MADFFTSDLHFGHANIIKYCHRPFATVDEMNKAIIERWNNVVTDTDEVYILGDLALGKLNETLPLVERLNGIKNLVPGNHDRCWSGHGKVRESDFKRYEDVGLGILDEDFLYDDNIRLCHFPTSGDSYTDERYPEHRPKLAHYEWLVHGHVHTQWKVNGRQINVGVDMWDFWPVHVDKIREIIDTTEYEAGLSTNE